MAVSDCNIPEIRYKHHIQQSQAQLIALQMSVIAEEFIREAIDNADTLFSCSITHPGYSCNEKALQMFLGGLKPVIRTYLPVHIVPFLLFKRKDFKKNPWRELFKLLLSIIKSVLFGVGYCFSYKRALCFLCSKTPVTSINLHLCAAIGGIPLLIEPTGRQAEIALFTMYNNFKILYNEARRRNLNVRIPAGNCVITGLALCILCYHYFNDKSSIKRNYVTLMDKLLSEDNE